MPEQGRSAKGIRQNLKLADYNDWSRKLNLPESEGAFERSEEHFEDLSRRSCPPSLLFFGSSLRSIIDPTSQAKLLPAWLHQWAINSHSVASWKTRTLPGGISCEADAVTSETRWHFGDACAQNGKSLLREIGATRLFEKRTHIRFAKNRVGRAFGVARRSSLRGFGSHYEGQTH